METRSLTDSILAALNDTPVVLLNGARQTGKSTLTKQLAQQNQAHYITFDNNNYLLAAKEDPAGFIEGLGNRAAILDEIQRVPELFLAIKKSVDEDRRPGRFILTGSADVLLLPNLADSLAGRMEILTLWPFSQGEIIGHKDLFIDKVFSQNFHFPQLASLQKVDYIKRIISGGYPEVVTRIDKTRQQHWFNSYIMTILQRDIRELANIDGLTQIPQLMELIAARSATLLNYAEISRSLGLPQTTLKRYMSLLQMTFLMNLLPAWHDNLGKRLTKSPKVFLGDTGLLCHLLHVDQERLQADSHLFGKLLENFVILELFKQSTWNETWVKLYHWRTQAGQEIDLLLEDSKGRIVAVEVKSAGTITARELNHLRALADDLGDRFHRGIIFYTGDSIISFAKNIHAVPINALWS